MRLFRSSAPVAPSIPDDPHTPRGLVLLQIDDFEPLETLFGDLLALEVIEEVEKRLLPRLPRGASLWRPERGRFALSVAEESGERLMALARNLGAAVAKAPLATSAGGVMITLSAGCSVAEPQHLRLLGPAATRALAAARRDGRARLRLLPAEAAIETDDQIARRAVNAIQRHRIFISFQPVMRIAGDPARPAIFHECLARLPNDGAPAIPAARFVPPLETRGELVLLDRLMLSQALDALALHPNARLSLNVCAATVQDREWLSIWDRRRLARPELVERLIVEMTGEAVLAEPIASGAFLERLRAGGTALALDDFGAEGLDGHHLDALRFDIAKLDPSLVREVACAPDSQNAVIALVEQARRLEMTVIAKHVETREQAAWLHEHGVEFAQGRLFGMPDANPDLGTTDAVPGEHRSTGSWSASPAASASP